MALGGVLGASLAIAWIFLPTVLEVVARRLTLSAGGEAVTLHVERAGLSSMVARDLAARFGRVEVALDNLEVEYGIRSLWRSEVEAVRMRGLTITVDATDLDPARQEGWFADSTDTETTPTGFRWPVEELEVTDAALTLLLPETVERFPLELSIHRTADGQVSFTLASDHLQQELRLSGTIAPATLSGEVRLEHAAVEPDFYQHLATRFGLLSLPANVAVNAERVTLQGELQLENGMPAAATAQAQLPRVQVRRGSIHAELRDVAVHLTRDGENPPAVRATGSVVASDLERGWNLASTAFITTLEDRHLELTMTDAAAARKEQISAIANVTLETNLPDAGQPLPLSGIIDVMAWNLAGRAGYPTRFDLRGTSDELQFESAELRMPGDLPLALHDLTGNIRGLTDDTTIVSVRAPLSLLAGPETLLPSGWKIAGGGNPLSMGIVTAEVTSTPQTLHTTVDLDDATTEPRVVTTGTFRFQPSLQARLEHEGETIQARAVTKLTAIESLNPGIDLGLNGVDVRLTLPAISEDAFVSLLSGEVMPDDFDATLEGKSIDSATAASSSIRLHFAAGDHLWSATKESELAVPHGRVGGTTFTEVKLSEQSTLAGIDHTELLRTLSGGAFGPLARQLLANSTIALDWSASSLEVPGGTNLQWLSGNITKRDAGSADLVATAQAGILRSGPESLEQVGFEVTTGGSMDSIAVEARMSALLEGSDLAASYQDTLTIDWPAFAVAANGSFELTPYAFRNSDVISRWVPEFPGLSLSGTIAATGTTVLSPADDGFDGTLIAQLSSATVSYPQKRVRVNGIEGSIRFDSLKSMRTPPGQVFRFAEAQARDFALDHGVARFRLDGLRRIYVEETSVGIFGGTVGTGPFSLFLPDPDVAVVFAINSVDASQLVRQFDLFKGSVTGRLSGRLPVALLAGRPLIGQGFLELDQGVPSTLKIDADGLFTAGLPKGGLRNEISRLGNELAEEGLENLAIQNLHVDLFRPEYPGTPVRIELSGVSDTPRAHVPMEIVTNVNGSVAEVIDFVMQFLLH